MSLGDEITLGSGVVGIVLVQSLLFCQRALGVRTGGANLSELIS